MCPDLTSEKRGTTGRDWEAYRVALDGAVAGRRNASGGRRGNQAAGAPARRAPRKVARAPRIGQHESHEAALAWSLDTRPRPRGRLRAQRPRGGGLEPEEWH